MGTSAEKLLVCLLLKGVTLYPHAVQSIFVEDQGLRKTQVFIWLILPSDSAGCFAKLTYPQSTCQI